VTVQIIQADARRLPLADDSADLIVTSPPYFGLRSYTDGGEHYEGQIGAEATPAEYVDALIDCTREWMRVLKPSGSLFINLGDKYSTYEGPRNVPQNSTAGLRQGMASQEGKRHTKSAPSVYGVPYKSLLGLPWRYALRCIDELELILRAEIIWDKPNGMPESCTDRARRSHEQWFHFAQEQRYFAAVDEIREAPSGYSRPSIATSEARGGQCPRLMRDSCNPKGRLPGSVWEIATQPLNVPEQIGTDHYAAFPLEWPRRIIAAWCPPGGDGLDPFGGTGTTAIAADVSGRMGVSVDRSADYCRIAAWRTTDPGERARAMKVPKPAPEMAGQGALFEMEVP
jgi:site-specific DNA-methyltransferase (cytosine-N4-specific)